MLACDPPCGKKNQTSLSPLETYPDGNLPSLLERNFSAARAVVMRMLGKVPRYLVNAGSLTCERVDALGSGQNGDGKIRVDELKSKVWRQKSGTC